MRRASRSPARKSRCSGTASRHAAARRRGPMPRGACASRVSRWLRRGSGRAGSGSSVDATRPPRPSLATATPATRCCASAGGGVQRLGHGAAARRPPRARSRRHAVVPALRQRRLWDLRPRRWAVAPFPDRRAGPLPLQRRESRGRGRHRHPPVLPTSVGAQGTLSADGQELELELRLVDTTAGELSGTVYLPDGTTPAAPGSR